MLRRCCARATGCGPFARLEPLRAALRAGVPIVPIAVLGSEEAAPVLGRLGLSRLRRLPLASALPLPAKLKLRFLDRVTPGAQTDAYTLGADLRLTSFRKNLFDTAVPALQRLAGGYQVRHRTHEPLPLILLIDWDSLHSSGGEPAEGAF